MDHPWRFAAGADLCPVCSARHFPFCPPPPLPPHPFPYDLHPPPPPPHPFPYDLHPPPPPPHPFPYDLHPPPPPPSMWGPPAPGAHDPHPYEFPGREGPHKRMRLGEAPPFDPYDFGPPPPPGRDSVEGDRLLGLIRDHGRNPLPGSAWRDEPCPPDGGFGYGGRGYPSQYPQGGDFANFDHAGMLPPQVPMHDRSNGFSQGFAPGEGSHERYLDIANHHYHQFHPEALPGVPPLPTLLPPYAEAANPNGSRSWLPEASAVPSPPEPPFPSHRDYYAAPPRTTANSSLFPVLSDSPATTVIPTTAHNLPQAHPMPNANCYDGHIINDEGSGSINRPLSEQHLIDGRSTNAQHSKENSKVTIINACNLFKQPCRASRPDHIVIILRGLPGSGKSYLAKALRDLEVENGANAPRIHSMDDYFMIEVEKKLEDNEGSKPSSASKGRRQLTKKVIEYCYEAEMEETYRSSMLKSFKKTLDEGNFTFVIVDDRNLRVADFAQFWATAKHSGYEVYLLEAPYKDPTGCAARNVHGFTLDDIKKMAADWEEAPPLYLQLDIHSLFHDDNLRGHSIQEVDMDTEDIDDSNETTSRAAENSQKAIQEAPHNESYEGFSKPGENWSAVEDDLDAFKELGQSKWSKDFEDDTEKSANAEGNTHALSGLAQTYTHHKRVSWGDRLEKGGFSIAATKRKPASSLVIGPGSGYNLVSNPLAEDNSTGSSGKTNNETKKRFSEQLRDEGQSFRAVFDKRKQRIGVFENGDDE